MEKSARAKNIVCTREDCIVVGRGLIGASAAKYLAVRGNFKRVFCVGLSEQSVEVSQSSSVEKNQQKIFGAHYDEGRITRQSDPDPVWGSLATRSISRYRSIEENSQVRFFHEVGHLAVGNDDNDYIHNVATVAQNSRVSFKTLEETALAQKFPNLCLKVSGNGIARGVLNISQADGYLPEI